MNTYTAETRRRNYAATLAALITCLLMGVWAGACISRAMAEPAPLPVVELGVISE